MIVRVAEAFSEFSNLTDSVLLVVLRKVNESCRDGDGWTKAEAAAGAATEVSHLGGVLWRLLCADPPPLTPLRERAPRLTEEAGLTACSGMAVGKESSVVGTDGASLIGAHGDVGGGRGATDGVVAGREALDVVCADREAFKVVSVGASRGFVDDGASRGPLDVVGTGSGALNVVGTGRTPLEPDWGSLGVDIGPASKFAIFLGFCLVDLM